MCLFSVQVTKNGIWKALMPSIRSRPEGPKYGKITYFGYPKQKLCVTLNFFLFLKNFFKNLFLRKDNFRK
jgi:hypothetical protein